MKPVIVLVVAFLALAALAATQAIQRNFFTVNTAPVVQATAGTNVFVTFTQAGQTRTYLVDVPTPSSLPFSVITNAPWLTNHQSTAVSFDAGLSVSNALSIHGAAVFDAELIMGGTTNAILYADGSATFAQGFAGIGITGDALFNSVSIDNPAVIVLANDGHVSFDSGQFVSDGLGDVAAKLFNGSGAGLTNVTVAATNVFSGGQLPIGTVSTGLSSVAGPLLTSNGVARSYSYNAGALTNLPAASLTGSGTNNTTGSAGSLTGGATNQVYAFGSSAGWNGSIGVSNVTMSGNIGFSKDSVFTIGTASLRPLTVSTLDLAAYRDVFATSSMQIASHAQLTSPNANELQIHNAYGSATYARVIVSNLSATAEITATNGVFGAYGCMTMSTGTVVVATSTSTNKFTAFSYVKTFGGIGSLTNTSIVVTNAGDYCISFGCSLLGGNGDAVKALILTNDAVCPLIMFEKTMQNPAIAETGFKEVVVNLPASCRVGIGIANGSANNTSVQNLCFNVKGAN